MNWIVNVFRTYPELAVFLTLALGFYIGPLKIKSFSLGNVTAVLLVGVLVGQMKINISPDVKAIFFLPFLFAVGYGVGPQFFRGLKKDGLPQVGYAVIVCLCCLIVPYLCAEFMGYNAGEGAGLLAGAQTISAVIGVADDIIKQLPIPSEKQTDMINVIPVCYAVTYIFGTVGSAWILATIGPMMLGGITKVRQQCKELEASMGNDDQSSEPGMMAADREVLFRTFSVTNDWFKGGKSVQAFESYCQNENKRLFVEKVRHDKQVVEVAPNVLLSPGDTVVLSGRREAILDEYNWLGPEVNDPELMHFPVEVLDVLISHKEIEGMTVKDLRRQDYMEGVFIRNIKKASISLPVLPGQTLDRGDLLTLVGLKKDVDRVSLHIGYADRPSARTNLMLVGLGLVLGGFLGVLTLHISGIPISLSTSGGALIAGLVFGWLRSRHPNFGGIPESALWLMNNAGLNIFIAVVGILAGPSFVEGLKQVGFNLFLMGVISTTVPLLIGVLLGKYLFKFHPAINLGAAAGSRTTTAALGALQEALGSSTPALGYTITYAIGNTLLIIWGVVIVLLLK